MGGQTLVKVGLLPGHVQLAQLHLAVRPGHLEGASHALDVVVPIRQRQRLFARVRPARGERDLDGGFSFNANAAAQAENRVEYRADRPRQSGARVHCGGRSRRPPAAEKARAIRLKLQRADERALHGEDVNAPDGPLIVGARAAATQQGGAAQRRLPFPERAC